MMRTEDILAEYADSLVDGNLSVTDLVRKHDIRVGSDVEALLILASQLETVLVKVAPTPQFIHALRQDLIPDSAQSSQTRLRLSPLQIGGLAAGLGGITVVATAGAFWLANRSRRAKLNPAAEASALI